MRLYPQSLFVLLLFYNVINSWVPSVFGQDFEQSFRIVAMEPERDKRAIDLGFLVRNLLMKSAYASNTKAAVSRNLINAKAATPRPTTTQRPTTTTTALAPIFDKSSFWFPFSASFGGYPLNNNVNLPQKVGIGVGPRPGVAPRPGPPTGVGPRPLSPIGPGPRGGGGFNFDYDYIDQLRPVQQPARRRRPTTTTAAPAPATTAAPPPAPAPALPLRRRPLPQRPSLLNYDYYDDYDYGGIEQTTAAAPPPPAPPTTRSPQPPSQTRPRGRTRGRQQNQQATRVPPRTGVPRLRNPLIYQYAQTNDFSTNNNNNGAAAAAPGNAGAANSNPNNVNQSTSATDETSQDANEAANDNDGVDYVDEANSTNDNSDDNAAIDPNNSEDYNDSSDNSNTNPNGNGSNGNNVNFNQVNRNNNEPPAQQAQGQSAFPDYNIDNSQPPPPQFNIPQGGGGAQPLLLDPRNFNGRGINSGGGRGGPAIPPSQLNQPYGLPSEYQNFQYPGFSDYGSQYQQPSSPFGYSAGYY